MDIVITIRDTTHDGRSFSPNDFLDAAYAAVERVKHSLPIDDNVSLISVGLIPDVIDEPEDEFEPQEPEQPRSRWRRKAE
jgi:hypothetical protein